MSDSEEKVRVEGGGTVSTKPWPTQFDDNPYKWYEQIGKVPKREWVGLTDEEIDYVEDNVDPALYRHFARAIEAKLKEKNT